MARVDSLLDSLLSQGGTDLHIAANAPPMIRVRGDLVAAGERALTTRDVEDLLSEVVGPPQIAELSEKHEIVFAHSYKTARFRVRYGTVMHGLEAVFRVISSRVPTLSELALPEVCWRFSDRRSGLTIIAGPAGSGKSTTLAAMLDQVNRTRGCHVLTLEDPIEQVFEPNRALFTQREIRKDAPDLALAIRAAARDDIDVCAISSLSNAEAIRATIELASTEMAVIACMNGGSVVSTLERIFASFTETELPRARNLLADALAGVIVQRLVQTQDGRRVLAHEILVATPQATTAIREGKTERIPPLMQAGQGQGMQTLDMALERLMSGGKIAPEAALATAFDKEAFSKIVARHRPDLVEPQIL
jgi:twitching motility protein PilT